MSNKKEEFEKIAEEGRNDQFKKIKEWLNSLSDVACGRSSLIDHLRDSCKWLVAEVDRQISIVKNEDELFHKMQLYIQEVENHVRDESLKTTCEHNFKQMETIYTDKYAEDKGILYIRIDRFYCTKCLDERTKRREDFCKYKPDWYVEKS